MTSAAPSTPSTTPPSTTATAGTGAPATRPTAAPRETSPWELPAPVGTRQLVLTRDEQDVTDWVRTPTGFHATAPASNVGTNTRTVLVPDAAPTRDHGACVSARHQGSPVQQGIVLRLHLTQDRNTAISVTKNVFADVDWVYNVTAWDSGMDPPFVKVAGFDMSMSTFAAGGPEPGVEPRLCARVRGTTLELKAWPQGMPEPAWGDPIATRSIELPAEATSAPGVAGWYLGHLPPGATADFDEATTWVEPPA